MKIFNHVMIFVLASLTLLSCGSQSKTYYPMHEGKTLTYSIDSEKIKTIEYFKDRKLEGKKVTPLKIDNNGEISFMFFLRDNKGVRIFAEQTATSSEPKVLEKVEYLFTEPFKPGQSWERDLQATLMMVSEMVPMTYVIQKGTESVTVAAGTFDKCMKVIATGSIEREKGLWGTVKLDVTRTDWYAPKVGLVKSVVHKVANHVLVPEETSITQLTGYSK